MGVIVAKIFDLASNELADISPIALEKSMGRHLNQARSFTIQAPAGHMLLTTVAGDGYRNLRKGNRKLLVWEDGDIIFHGRIFGAERTGDGTTNTVAITAFDPFMELGYDSDDRAGRPVRALKTDGGFIEPTFTPSVSNTPASAISGPDLIQQILTNSQGTDAESGANPGEGPLPIDLASGTFDLASPPAVDLSAVDKLGWPVMIGDFIATLVDTGAVDVDMRPVDPSEGFDPYIMVELSAVSSFGTDKSATVHFDYWTGDKNAAAFRHVEDFQTINNKLYDYIGPPVDSGDPGTRWTTNITPTLAPGPLATKIADSRTLYGGEFMSIREFDTAGHEADPANLPLYMALWLAEQGYRVEPRDLLYITPAMDAAGLFTAPQDFDVGDLIAINVGAEAGIDLAETQRVYGYTKTWDRQGVARLSELLTSADG
jgi:hypothetical protein